MWTLNRIAKRIHDKVLRNASIDNTRIYNLKGQALHYFEAEGLVRHLGYHKFANGNFGEILGNGTFTFHRPCEPRAGTDFTTIGVKIDSQDRDEAELDQQLAIDVVEPYLDRWARVGVHAWYIR